MALVIALLGALGLTVIVLTNRNEGEPITLARALLDLFANAPDVPHSR